MGDFKFKLLSLFLIFVTVSLVFNIDFKSQIEYSFDALNINVDELAEKEVDKIMAHANTEIFNWGYQTYPKPETVENKISEEKYERLTNLINLEKDYNALIIRVYETEEYVTARYFVELNEELSLNQIVNKYQETLLNAGYTLKENTYVKDEMEIQFVIKWDCITIIVKGL